MINVVTLEGNLGQDAELRQAGETDVLSFSIANTRKFGEGREKTVWMTVKLWGRRAGALHQYLTKGTRVTVTGSIEEEKWGQEPDIKRRMVVNASDVSLPPRGDGQHRQGSGGSDYGPGGRDDYNREPPRRSQGSGYKDNRGAARRDPGAQSDFDSF